MLEAKAAPYWLMPNLFATAILPIEQQAQIFLTFIHKLTGLDEKILEEYKQLLDHRRTSSHLNSPERLMEVIQELKVRDNLVMASY